MRSLIRVSVAVLALCLLAFSAHAFPLYGANNSLYEIDPSDGSHVVIDTGDPAYRLGLAYNGLTGTMYSVGPFDGILSTVDLLTGDTTAVGPANGTRMTGLTFSLDFSTLYAFDSNGGPLLAVDPSDGSAITIGPTGAGLLDLSTRSDGTIFAAGIDNGIFTVNTLTGAATHIGGALRFTAIAFDENDTLFGIEIVSDALYTIDTGTGNATLIGGDIGNDVRGMAFAIDVPEPATSALLGLALVGLGFARSRVN